MFVSDSGSGNFELCPPGTYVAQCCRLIDYGTVESSYEGKTTSARKVQIGWELLDSQVRRSDGAPFVLSRRFTMSLHENSALRPVLVGWRGVEFTKDELKKFDLKNVLGKLAMLTVVHQTRGDKSFANIQSVSRPPRGMQGDAPAGEPLLHLDLSEPTPDWSVFDHLASKQIDQICSSPEFLAHPNKPTWFKAAAPAPAPARPAPPPARPTAPAGGPPPGQFPDEDFADFSDVPF